MQRFTRETALARNFCWKQPLPTERALRCGALHVFLSHLFLPSAPLARGLWKEAGKASFVFASGLSWGSRLQPVQAGGLQVSKAKVTLQSKAGVEGVSREALQVSEQGRVSAGSELVLESMDELWQEQRWRLAAGSAVGHVQAH